MKTFFISDTHFKHKNVIVYDNRPYASVEEMDEDMIKKWNSVVGNDDVVWFLGDLAMSTNKEYIKSIVSQLKGHKKMVMGNHDNCKASFYMEAGFEEVYKHPIILKNFFVLSHEPMEFMNENYPLFFIYGHVHNSEAYNTKTEHTRCVSACRQDYYPIEIEEFNNYVQTKEKDIFNREL